MSEEHRTVTAPIEQEETRRARMFRAQALTSVVGAVAILLLFIALGLLNPEGILQTMAPVIVAFIVLDLLSMWLSQQGHLNLAIGIYQVAVTAGLFYAGYSLGGVTGPIVITLPLIPVVAGLLGGRRAARGIALIIAAAYATMAVLEATGVLRPQPMSGWTLQVVPHAMFLATLVISLITVVTFIGLADRSLATAQQQSQELAEANLRAEQAAQSEREAREREEKIAQQLRQTVRQYSAFLERVTAGDYSARLTLDETNAGDETAREMRELGAYLNSTVDALVTAVKDMEVIQRRYLIDAWESFVRAGAIHKGFRYRSPSVDVPESALSEADAAVEPTDDAWLEPMTQAVQDHDVTASEDELALPITLRGEVLGALGARRGESTGWSEDDVALVTAIADQLAQTIEGLRLLDEAQRRAARERLIGEFTDRVRATLDIETMLKTGAREARQALGLPELVVRLASQPADEAATD
jgi:hypothetical protein